MVAWRWEMGVVEKNTEQFLRVARQTVMKSRWMRLLCLLAALCTTVLGCAFQTAIDNGNTYVEQREYRRALVEYERALRLDPDSGEAKQLIAQVIPYALDEAEADMQGELDNARYEQAVRHVAYVKRYDAERAEQLRTKVKVLMRAHVEAHIAKGEMLKAYPLAIRTAKLFPKMEGLQTVFDRLRAHYIAIAETHTAAGRYADALAALDVIERHEPRMKSSLAPRRQKIRGLWADTVVVKAKAAETAEKLGAAAALYGRAFEIAGRDNDADAMRRLMRILRDDGAFQLVIGFTGDGVRRRSIEKLASPRLTAIEGVALATDDDGASMRADINTGRVTCSERYTTSSRSKDYVAGTRQVPNPAYDNISTRIDNATTDVNVLRPKVSSLSSRVTRLEGRLERCEQRQRNARASGERSNIPDCSNHRSQLSSAKSELSSAQSQLSSAESSLSSLTSQRAGMPRTLTEDIIETFTYEVRHHTRTCGLALTASLEPAWSGMENHRLSGKSSTRDDSHEGYSQYGIAQDPLIFPQSDGDLVAAADSSAATGVAGLIKKKVTSYYRAMTDRAFNQEREDPVATVDMLVAIVAAGRSHLDPGRRLKIQERLHELYGLESIDTLRK